MYVFMYVYMYVTVWMYVCTYIYIYITRIQIILRFCKYTKGIIPTIK